MLSPPPGEDCSFICSNMQYQLVSFITSPFFMCTFSAFRKTFTCYKGRMLGSTSHLHHPFAINTGNLLRSWQRRWAIMRTVCSTCVWFLPHYIPWHREITLLVSVNTNGEQFTCCNNTKLQSTTFSDNVWFKCNTLHTYQIKLRHDAILMPLEKYSKRVKPHKDDHCHAVQLMLFPRCTNDHIL